MKKTHKIFFVIITLILLFPFILFFLNHVYNLSRFKVVNEYVSNKDKLSNIFQIDEKNVKYLSEFYHDKRLVGYDCILDSILYIKVYKLGVTNNQNISDIIINTKTDPIDPLMIFDIVMPSPNKYQLLFESYNVKQLNSKKIEKIQLYMGQNSVNVKKYRDNILGFENITNTIKLSFNNRNSIDFEMFGKESKVDIYFYKNEKNDIFFIYINKLYEVNSDLIESKLFN